MASTDEFGLAKKRAVLRGSCNKLESKHGTERLVESCASVIHAMFQFLPHSPVGIAANHGAWDLGPALLSGKYLH